MDVLAFDWESGKFKRDLNYLAKYFNHPPELEEISEKEFNVIVNRLICELKDPNTK